MEGSFANTGVRSIEKYNSQVIQDMSSVSDYKAYTQRRKKNLLHLNGSFLHFDHDSNRLLDLSKELVGSPRKKIVGVHKYTSNDFALSAVRIKKWNNNVHGLGSNSTQSASVSTFL